MKAKGVQVVACISVNDAFVMAAWGETHGANGKVRMLADYNGAYTKVRPGVRLVSYIICRPWTWSWMQLVYWAQCAVSGECQL